MPYLTLLLRRQLLKKERETSLQKSDSEWTPPQSYVEVNYWDFKVPKTLILTSHLNPL